MNLRSSDRDLFGEMPVQRKGAPLFADQWPNKKVARIVELAVSGATARSICDDLADGTLPNEVRVMLSHWGIKERHTVPVPVHLNSKLRAKLFDDARERGKDGHELLADCARHTIKDTLYEGIIDDSDD